MKRFLALIMGILCVAACVAGCAQTESSQAQGDSAPAPTKDSADYFATWTQSDWDNASAEEKEHAVIFLVSEAAASNGDDEEVVQAAIDDAEESLTPEQYAEIEDAVTSYFDKAGSKGTLEDSISSVIGTISKYAPIG